MIDDEYYISAAQPEEEEHAWVSCAHVDQEWSQGAGPSSRSRPEEIDGQRRTVGAKGRDTAGPGCLRFRVEEWREVGWTIAPVFLSG